MAILQIDVKVQAEFLSAIAQNTGLVDAAILRYVEPEYFSVPSYQWFIKLMKSRKWKSVALDYLDQELLSVEQVELREQYRNQLIPLFTRQLTFEDDAHNTFRAFIAYCLMNSNIRDSFEGFSRAGRVDYLLDSVRQGVQTANDVLKGENFRSVDYVDDYAVRMQRRLAEKSNPSIRPRIMTGIPGLDNQFVIKAPQVINFLAPFKRYKSIILNAMGFSGLLQGFNVLHVTYENSKELTADRYDSQFSTINYDRVVNAIITQEEKDFLDKMFAWMSSWNNRLRIIKCESKITPLSEVISETERLQMDEGFVPDILIVDYLNIVKPSSGFKEERLEQAQVVWDLKNYADQWDAVVYTASQAKVEAVREDRMDSAHQGKAIDISQGVDMTVAIDQTSQEEADGIIVLSPLFSRHTKIQQDEIILDADISRMCISRSLHDLWQCAAKIHEV